MVCQHYIFDIYTYNDIATIIIVPITNVYADNYAI